MRWLMWEWRDWSLWHRTRGYWQQVFALKCDCGRWSLGCRDHWFCGICEPCRAKWESE